MNERDYLMAETMVISTGIFVIVTIFCMMFIYHLPFSVGLVIALGFIAFITFFFGLYTHMKRRIYILENEEIIREGHK